MIDFSYAAEGGEDTYQTVAYAINGLPHQAAQSIFPMEPSKEAASISAWALLGLHRQSRRCSSW